MGGKERFPIGLFYGNFEVAKILEDYDLMIRKGRYLIQLNVPEHICQWDWHNQKCPETYPDLKREPWG
jgi:hypothetical protein